MLLPMQLRVPLAFFATRAQFWLLLSLLSTVTLLVLSAEQNA